MADTEKTAAELRALADAAEWRGYMAALNQSSLREQSKISTSKAGAIRPFLF